MRAAPFNRCEASSMWTAFLANHLQWQAVFTDPNTLRHLSVDYVMFRDNGVWIKVIGQIIGDGYPNKWHERQYNAYGFDLLLSAVSDVEMIDFNFYGALNITVTRHDSYHHVQLEIGPHCKLNCRAQSLEVINIKAYHDDGAV
jgi:hypothetical protein